MIKLIYKDVLKKALEYARKKQLGVFKHSNCMYIYPDGARCVIGAGMPEKLLEEICYDEGDNLNETDILALMNANLVTLDNRHAFYVLQKKHDDACKREISINAFIDYLNEEASAHGLRKVKV